MMGATYVYRLVVEIPEGVDWEHPPQAWLDYRADLDTELLIRDPEDPSAFFSWPQRRNFLTKAPADRMAERLRSYGATVTVERSRPVIWENA